MIDKEIELISQYPLWRELKNEVGIEYNQFNIIRGKQNLKIGKNFWLGYFCILDASSGLEIGDNVTISSGCHIYSHDSSDYRKYNLKKDPINGTHVKSSSSYRKQCTNRCKLSCFTRRHNWFKRNNWCSFTCK